MVRKTIIQLVVVFFLCLLLTVLFAGYQWKLEQANNNKSSLRDLSTLTSSVNLIVSQIDLSNKASFHLLSERLSDVPEIHAWTLKSPQSEPIIVQRNGNTDAREFVSTNYFYIQAPNQQGLYEIEVEFYIRNATTLPSPINPATLLVILLISGVLFGLMLWRLGWVKRLEDFAKYVLTTDGQLSVSSKYQFHNVIGHALNQLLLNNSLLSRSKSELMERIRTTSYVDEITELGNHLFFKAELEVRLHNHEEAESGLVVILSFVREQGSEFEAVINQRQVDIAHVLRGVVEENEHALAAKLKNDDFALLLPNNTIEQTDRICKKLVAQLAASVFSITPKQSYFVDIGISSYKQGFDYYNIMAEADMALRNAQLQGANNWYVYGEPLSAAKSKGRLRWRSFLRGILDRRDISLFKQKVDMFDESCNEHCEILTRVEDEGETLCANTFLTMANQCGLAVEFDRLIVDRVIEYALYRSQSGTKQTYIVNLFIDSLLNEKFETWLINKLTRYPELCKQLVFELSENHLSRHISRVAAVMRKIESLGCRWSIEHFGSPEEKFDYLNEIPVYMIKIDRRIVNSIADNPTHQLLLASHLVSLKTQGILVIAEGVERQEDADYLIKSGLDGGQGYFYEEPRALTNEPYLKAV